METKFTLAPNTIRAAQDLVRSNIGSADFYREAAALVKSPALERAFTALALTRGEQGSVLSSYLRLNHADVPEEGTLDDSMHEIWTKLRGLLNAGNKYVLLIEAARAEERIKTTYEELIKATAGSALSRVLHDQYTQVQASCDAIYSMRDNPDFLR